MADPLPALPRASRRALSGRRSTAGTGEQLDTVRERRRRDPYLRAPRPPSFSSSPDEEAYRSTLSRPLIRARTGSASQQCCSSTNPGATVRSRMSTGAALCGAESRGPPDTRSSSSGGVSLRSPETLASASLRQRRSIRSGSCAAAPFRPCRQPVGRSRVPHRALRSSRGSSARSASGALRVAEQH